MRLKLETESTVDDGLRKFFYSTVLELTSRFIA